MLTSSASKVAFTLTLRVAAVGVCLVAMTATAPSMLARSGPGGAGKASAAVPRQKSASQARVQKDYGRLPLSFEPNAGQISRNNEVRYLSRGRGYSIYLNGSGATLALRQLRGNARRKSTPITLRMRLVNGNPAAPLAALGEQPGKSNYLIGNDPSKWLTGVAHYGEVAVRGVYPGVDLIYHGNQGQLEYDFEVAPGASPSIIRMALEGAHGARVNAQGEVVVEVDGGEVLFRAPLAYQKIGGERHTVASSYALKHGGIAFRVAKYDKTLPLVIDPTLAYSTYLGGSSIDGANAIAVAPDNTAFVAGETFSSDFPTVHPLQGFTGSEDAFVAKISADGSTLLYSTYLGGSVDTYASAIAVDTFGDAYVAGSTDSADYPATPLVFDTLCGSDGKCGASYNLSGLTVFNGFVTELNSAGSGLSYSSFIGGYQETQANAISVDGAHNAYITGEIGPPITPQQNGPAAYLPIDHGFQSTNGGTADAFVLKVDATASDALYSSYLGGVDEDIGYAITADSNGNAYVTGLTYSTPSDTPPFPITAGALQSTYAGGGDAFLVKVDTTTSGAASLLYSSYVGGSGLDEGKGIGVDSGGDAYITGTITSTASTLGFAVPAGAYQADCALDSLSQCEGDAFLAKLNPAQSGAASLLYFTYLGGTAADAGYAIALDPNDNVYVTGSTVSSDFPVTSGVFQTQYGGGDADAFVAKMTLAGKGTSDLGYSSYLGGTNTETGNGIGVDVNGSAYVAGQTCSVDFPIANALQNAPNGNCDAFVTKVSTLPGIALNPAGLIFPTQNVGTTSQSQTITLTNADTAVTISSIAMAGPFAQTNTCGSSVAADSSCTITVTFTPTSSGVQKGTITLTDSAPGSPQTVNLTGSTSSVTLSTSTIAFGNQALGGTSAAQTVTVTNAGTTALTISSVAVSGAFSESSTDNGDCVKAPLQATTSCTIAIDFTPVVAGSTIGALTVTDNAVGSPQVVLLTGTGLAEPAVSLSPTTLTFASQVVNTTSAAQLITITNTGSASLTVSTVTVTGPFTETNTCSAAVAPSALCTVSVTFAPTAGGGALGTLTITDNAPSSPQTVSLTGTGTASPIVTLTPASLTFTNQDLSTTSPAQVVALKNTGGAALAISGVTASGDFAQTNTCGSSVGAGASCTISVTFAPTASGSRNGSVTITDNATDSPQTVLLAGTGVAAPAVALSVTSLNFTAQPVGTSSAAQTLTVTNSGTANLTLSGISATGAFSQTSTCGASLAPQATCVISVVFAPTTTGTASGSLKLTDNAPNSPQTLTLGGSGSDFAVATTPASGSVVAGNSATFTVTVTPSFGFNAAVNVSCSGVPAASTCVAYPNSVTPSGTAPITATLTIGTTARTMVSPRGWPSLRIPGPDSNPASYALVLLILLTVGAALVRGHKPGWALAVLPLTLLAMLAVAACGGGSGYTNPTGTPVGNYTVKITGTSGSLSHTSTVNLTVQ
ncbi:MAG TPA: choice-of-anchor D domain-containing protein [Terriglobia bacterium]|nr:choice-of-anchor D domain-containing protein [Terriglobia bacterium]